MGATFCGACNAWLLCINVKAMVICNVHSGYMQYMPAIELTELLSQPMHPHTNKVPHECLTWEKLLSEATKFTS